MEDQILDAPVDVNKNLNYAGFWIRVVAYILDGILIGALNYGVVALVMDASAFMQPNFTFQLFSLAVGIAYFAGMESSSRQGTLGKMAVGIKVGNQRGEPISFANALGRYFAKILSAITLLIGFMMVGWDSKKQGLHDKLAGTYVFFSK